jgi:hypothetical protein
MEADRVKRQDEATVWIEPVMLACSEDRKFFEALEPDVRALVTLWTLAADVHRKGVSQFVENEPDWIVKDVPRAAEALGENTLGDRFSQLLPTLKRGKHAGRLSAKAVDWSEHKGIERIVSHTESDRSFTDTLAERVIASRNAFGALRARAETIHSEAREARKRQAEAVRAKARSKWDGMREGAKPWSMATRFAAEEVIVHTKFGVGRVRSLIAPNKIEVEFEDGVVRTLLHRAP